MIDGGERRGRKHTGERGRVFRGIRRSVPLDRVLDAVKRTWKIHRIFSPAVYFFFFFSSYIARWRVGFIVGPSVKVGTPSEEDDSERENENTVRRRQDGARAKSKHGRRKTDARVARFIYCVCCNSAAVRGRPQIESRLHPRSFITHSLPRERNISYVARRTTHDAMYFLREARLVCLVSREKRDTSARV